jgi:hypothetical protein
MSHDTSSQLGPVAFFYCANNSSEPARRNPEEILRCIFRQLLDPNAVQDVGKKYYSRKANGLGKLNIEESTAGIIELSKQYPTFTIVIDAFEECCPNTRWKLLDALQKIVADSVMPVKVFISSRAHVNIPTKLRDRPQICINEKDNAEDIKNFIEYQVEQSIENRIMLDGQISPELRLRVVETLTKGAQGM